MKTYVGFVVACDKNLSQKLCCATLSILYSWQLHVVQQHKQNALLCFHCKNG